MNKFIKLLLIITLYFPLFNLCPACHQSESQESPDSGPDAADNDDTDGNADNGADADIDADTDADTDADADADSDSDTDIDSDTDTDSDADPPCDMYLEWVENEGGYDPASGKVVSLFPDGSVIISGGFHEMIFGFQSKGHNDIFIAEYDKNGALKWAKAAGGTGNDLPSGIDTFIDGSAIISGELDDSAWFGEGEPNETYLTVDDALSLFIAKYNSDGTLAWAKNAGGWASGTDVAVLDSNSALVTGYFSNFITFGKGETEETELISEGNADILLARFNHDGTLEWAKRAGGPEDDGAGGISLLDDGSAIITGIFTATAKFGKGEDNETSLTSIGGRDIFVAKYDSEGNLEWAKSAGGSDSDTSADISSFPDGSSVITGDIRDSAIFGEGEENETQLEGWSIFVARYNPDGTLAWAKSAGGSEGKSIVAHPDGFTLAMGFGGPSSSPDHGTFIAKYDTDGGLACSKMAADTYGGYDIASIDGGTVYLTGGFCEAVFGPGDPNETYIETMYGCEGGDNDFDMFIAKFSP